MLITEEISSAHHFLLYALVFVFVKLVKKVFLRVGETVLAGARLLMSLLVCSNPFVGFSI